MSSPGKYFSFSEINVNVYSSYKMLVVLYVLLSNVAVVPGNASVSFVALLLMKLFFVKLILLFFAYIAAPAVALLFSKFESVIVVGARVYIAPPVFCTVI